MAANFNRHIHLDNAASRWKSSVRSSRNCIRDVIESQIYSFQGSGGNESKEFLEDETEEVDSGAENSDVD